MRNSLWVRALQPAELAQVLRESRERCIPVGGHATRCSDPAEHWVGVIEGLVKMSVSQPDGRVSTFTGVTAGGWAGEGSLLKPGCWRDDGVALRPTRLACVPRHSFERLVATSLPFNHFLLGQVNARLSLFIGLVGFDRLLGPDARVARCLASLFDPALYPCAWLTQPTPGVHCWPARCRRTAPTARPICRPACSGNWPRPRPGSWR